MPVHCRESNFLPFPGIPTEAHKIETSVLLEILGREETFSLPSRPFPKERGTYFIAWLGESHWLRVAQPPWVFLRQPSLLTGGACSLPLVATGWGRLWPCIGENLQFGMGVGKTCSLGWVPDVTSGTSHGFWRSFTGNKADRPILVWLLVSISLKL